MKTRLLLLPLLAMGLGMQATVHASKVHVHGNAEMQIVVDGKTVEIALLSPLDSLVGFERAPSNEKQRKALQALEEKFRTPASLFVPTAAAQCEAQPAELILPFGKGAAQSVRHGEHSELEAIVRFQCGHPGALKGMEVKLFEAFPELRRVDVQTVSGSDQSAARLTPKQRNLQW